MRVGSTSTGRRTAGTAVTRRANHDRPRRHESISENYTRSKLFLGFGLVSLIIMIMASVGVFTLRQLSTHSQTVACRLYGASGRFLPRWGTALTKHQNSVDVASATKQADFAQDVSARH